MRASLNKQNPCVLRIVFIKGVSTNIGRYALQNPISFKNQIIASIGNVRSVKVKDDHIILTCENQTKKTTALLLSDIHGQSVKVSLPSSNNQRSHSNPTEKLSKGIIFGVSLSLTDDDIISETNCSTIQRLSKLQNGKRENTETVVLTFKNEELPQNVNIGFLKYKVKTYIPLPFRCTNCQKFGHSHNNCSRSVVCPRCAGNHSYSECTKKDQPKCSNCHGDHSAAWSGCPNYVQVKNSIKVAVTEKISFRDALLKVNSSVSQSVKPQSQNIQKLKPSQIQKTPVAVMSTTIPSQTATYSAETSTSNPQNQVVPPQVEEQISLLGEKIAKFTDLLKYCIVGILLSLDSKILGPEDAVGLIDLKNTLFSYANTCGIHLSEIYQTT